MEPTAIRCVAPSRVAVGEDFAIKVKVLGPVREIACHGAWNDRKPALHGPFNRNVQRGIQYHDNCLPEWRGTLTVEAGAALSGPKELLFDGTRQGFFPGDTRPIRVIPDADRRIIRKDSLSVSMGPDDFCYVRVATERGNMAWSSPRWE